MLLDAMRIERFMTALGVPTLSYLAVGSFIMGNMITRRNISYRN